MHVAAGTGCIERKFYKTPSLHVDLERDPTMRGFRGDK
jgi:hypothetical protein